MVTLCPTRQRSQFSAEREDPKSTFKAAETECGWSAGLSAASPCVIGCTIRCMTSSKSIQPRTFKVDPLLARIMAVYLVICKAQPTLGQRQISQVCPQSTWNMLIKNPSTEPTKTNKINTKTMKRWDCWRCQAAARLLGHFLIPWLWRSRDVLIRVKTSRVRLRHSEIKTAKSDVALNTRFTAHSLSTWPTSLRRFHKGEALRRSRAFSRTYRVGART